MLSLALYKGYVADDDSRSRLGLSTTTNSLGFDDTEHQGVVKASYGSSSFIRG